MSNDDLRHLIEKGLVVRRRLFGDDYVDSAFAGAAGIDRPIQELVTAFGYGAVWSRPGLSLQTRSLVTIALLSALNRPDELKHHVAGALRNGVNENEILEILLHVILYCGAPAGIAAGRVVRQALGECENAPNPNPTRSSD